MTKPIAFMVMPFEKKKIDSDVAGVPAEVDFNALWANVHLPVLAGDREAARAAVREVQSAKGRVTVVVPDMPPYGAKVARLFLEEWETAMGPEGIR